MAYTTSHKNTNDNPASEIARLGAEMAKAEINLLDVASNYLVYEFSFVNGDRMKKWGKRIAPILDSIEETYAGILFLVESERKALGQ